MISTIIIDPDRGTQERLQNFLGEFYPVLTIEGCVDCPETGAGLFGQTKPELLFFNLAFKEKQDSFLSILLTTGYFETIFLDDQNEQVPAIMQSKNSACLLKPIQQKELVLAVNQTIQRILARKNTDNKKIEKPVQKLSPDDLIGIPTMKGYEFISVDRIVRCEGLQKCTRVVTCDKTNIVSSYHLGQFIRLLEPYGFFPVHRSHLINLKKMVRYAKEGVITMGDGVGVPLARRRKEGFLKRINRF